MNCEVCGNTLTEKGIEFEPIVDIETKLKGVKNNIMIEFQSTRCSKNIYYDTDVCLNCKLIIMTKCIHNIEWTIEKKDGEYDN